MEQIYTTLSVILHETHGALQHLHKMSENKDYANKNIDFTVLLEN